MKLSKLVKICKSARSLYLFDTKDGVQWLGNAKAMFPLFNHPIYAEENIFPALDIDEKQRDKIMFKRFSAPPPQISIDDSADDECPVDRAGAIALYYAGKYLIPYKTQQGIMFVDGDNLAPLADDHDKILYERHTPSGETYFAIKSGFMISGIVTPENIVDETLIRQLRALYEQCEMTLYNQTDDADTGNGEQQTIDRLKEMYGAEADDTGEDDE